MSKQSQSLISFFILLVEFKTVKLFNNDEDNQEHFLFKVFPQKLNTLSLGELEVGIDKTTRATQLNCGSCCEITG